ncbi:MAG TPA: DNA primase [Candidatus Methylacidiphilales bacterium]|nr:DNA primase [Candidatus Methylacidiphilales bacterium]
MIPPDIVEQVRHASDIVDVIGGYVPLKKAGSKFKALSPFQKEKTPSFYVNPQMQIFKCFSSGHGGDVFKFLMLMENMSFPEAVRRLAQRAGIAVPESGGNYDPKARSQREELLALNAAVAAWWHKLLKSDPSAEPARAYLKSRDFSESLADEFGLGYAPDSFDAMMKWAQKAGYSREALELGRLISTNDRGNTYDFFRGRLMIPIHNDAGEVVAFSGRLLDPNAKAMKYVNSSDTPVFNKGRVLFGLNKSKRPIIEAGSAILCEGQIDLMRCWQHGIRNIVAPQGTAFTDQQARMLKRLAQEVVVCFDSDANSSGQKAAVRAIDVLLKEDLQIRIARIPQGEDPDSLLRKNPVAVFETILREAKDYTRHLLDVACEHEDIASPRGRGLVAAKMALVIAKIPNAVQKETFLLEVARRLEVPRAAIEEEVRKAEAQLRRTEQQQRDYPSASAPGESGDAPAKEPLPPIEGSPIIESMLTLLFTHPELAPQVSRSLDPKWLEGRGGAEVLLQLLDAHAHDAFESAEQFLGECDERTRDFVAGLLIEKDTTKSFLQAPGRPLSDREKKLAAEFEKELKGTPEDLLHGFLALLERDWKRQRLQFLTLNAKSPELTVEERLKYLTEIESIRRQFPDLKP